METSVTRWGYGDYVLQHGEFVMEDRTNSRTGRAKETTSAVVRQFSSSGCETGFVISDPAQPASPNRQQADAPVKKSARGAGGFGGRVQKK